MLSIFTIFILGFIQGTLNANDGVASLKAFQLAEKAKDCDLKKTVFDKYSTEYDKKSGYFLEHKKVAQERNTLFIQCANDNKLNLREESDWLKAHRKCNQPYESWLHSSQLVLLDKEDVQELRDKIVRLQAHLKNTCSF